MKWSHYLHSLHFSPPVSFSLFALFPCSLAISLIVLPSLLLWPPSWLRVAVQDLSYIIQLIKAKSPCCLPCQAGWSQVKWKHLVVGTSGLFWTQPEGSAGEGLHVPGAPDISVFLKISQACVGAFQSKRQRKNIPETRDGDDGVGVGKETLCD